MPLSEIEIRASRSSGPGGQHANVTASRIEAIFDVRASSVLSDAQKARVAAKLGPRVTAVAQDARSQARNRDLALERLAQRLAARAARPAPAHEDAADDGEPPPPAGRQAPPRRDEARAAARRRRLAAERDAMTCLTTV